MKFCLIRMHKDALVANAKLWEYDTESHKTIFIPSFNLLLLLLIYKLCNNTYMANYI